MSIPHPEASAAAAADGSTHAEQGDIMLQAALDLAKHGLHVFALHARSKAPATPNGFYDASCDPAVIRAMWHGRPDCNVGIRTGAVSGIIGLDVDNKPGKCGAATLEGLIANLGELPATVKCCSGDNGFHLFFKHPGIATQTRTNGLGTNVDVFGETGYLVTAPSIHPDTGLAYEWAPGRAFGDVEPAELPPRWLQFLRATQARSKQNPEPAPPGATNSSGRHTTPDEDRWAKTALDEELAILRAATEGARNTTLNKCAYNLGRLVGGGFLGEERVRRELVTAALLIGLGKQEALRTVNSGLRDGKKSPSPGPKRSTPNGASHRGATMDEPEHAAAPSSAWQPTENDLISGLQHLSRIVLSSRARYLELAQMPITYTWRDVLVAGTIGLVAGPPGSGKTTLVYLYVAARAARSGFIMLLGREVYAAKLGQRILIIEAEHSEPSAARKLLASLRVLGLDDSVLEGDRVLTIARKAVTLASPAWSECVRLIAAGFISDVIVDTVARFAPADANAEGEQVAIYEQIAQALELAPKDKPLPTCLLVAHTRKGAAAEDIEGVSGSTQRTGQADSVLLAEATRDGGRVLSTRVTAVKLREDPGDRWPQPHSFAIRDGKLVQERCAPAPPAPDKRAAAEQQRRNELDSWAFELAQLVDDLPGSGTVELRKAAKSKFGWGNPRFEKVKAHLCDGLYGVRLVNRSANPRVCKWFIERVESTSETEGER